MPLTDEAILARIEQFHHERGYIILGAFYMPKIGEQSGSFLSRSANESFPVEIPTQVIGPATRADAVEFRDFCLGKDFPVYDEPPFWFKVCAVD